MSITKWIPKERPLLPYIYIYIWKVSACISKCEGFITNAHAKVVGYVVQKPCAKIMILKMLGA